MSIGFVNTIIFLGAMQGILLAVILFQRYRELAANRILGLMMLNYSIILLNLLYRELEFYRWCPYLMLLPLALTFCVGPLHYFYTRYLIQPGFRLVRRYWLHFLPAGIYLVSTLPALLKSRTELITALEQIEATRHLRESTLFNLAIALHFIFYMLLTLRELRRFSGKLKFHFSAIEKIRVNWIRNITILVIGVVLEFVFENILLLNGINFSNFFNLTSFLFAIAVYAMGYLGLSKTEIFANPEIAASMRDLAQSKDETPEAGRRYEKSGLSPEKAKDYLTRLLDLMRTEKPYTNPDLTLTELAGQLGISPHNLSEVLNTQLQRNFFDFVNGYRVEAVRKILSDPTQKHLKILAIAFEAGFNSKTSFNTIFKKETGMTPSGFQKRAGA